MSTRPRIFIGSSQEAFNKGIPDKLQIKLSNWCDAQTWKSIFYISQTSIENIEKSLPDFDAYVFILTPDVITIDRGTEYKSARDNLLFEIGFAMGLKGRENTFIIMQGCEKTDENIKLPSDIFGVNYGEFRYTDEIKEADLETLSNKIKEKYFQNHSDSADKIANDMFEKKAIDLSREIASPIINIKDTIEKIGTALENDISVLSGAQKSGIVNIFPNRYERIAGGSLHECIINEFTDTNEPICILGISLGDYFLDRGVMHKCFIDLIKQKHADKDNVCKDTNNKTTHIKALIVDPKCRALIERAFWEAGPEYCQNAEAYMDSTTYIETDGAARISHRLQNKYGSLEVRCYDQAPTCFLLLTENYVFVENYTYAARGSSCPNLQIKARTDLYKLYKSHFDNIWECATPIEKYNPSEALDKGFFSIYEERIEKSCVDNP